VDAANDCWSPEDGSWEAFFMLWASLLPTSLVASGPIEPKAAFDLDAANDC
jgi:hypothetical protein